MKFKFLLSTCLTVISVFSYAQLTHSPPNTFAKCPNEWIVYTANNPVSAACIYDWMVTNGEIQGGFQSGSTSTFSGGNQVQIKWFDTTQSGQLRVQARDCNPSSGNSTPTISAIPILSINGVNPGAITGDDNVTVNVTANKVYSISQINFPNIGSGDVNPKQVNGYEWEIPAGWTVVSGGNTKSITVTTDNCSGGNIRVRGKNTACTGNTFYSNWSTVKTVTRTLGNPGAISSSTGKTTVMCSDQTPITYSVSSVAGATSYVWTYPSGWQVQGSATGSSITLTPNGLNGGTITVKAEGCGIQSQASSSISITVMLTDPSNPSSISGPNDVCSSTTFTVQNQPANSTVTWSSNNTNGLTFNSSTGVATRVNNFNGPVIITAGINTHCGTVSINRTVWVGVPTHNKFEIVTYGFSYPPDNLFYACPEAKIDLYVRSNYIFLPTLEDQWTISGSYGYVGPITGLALTFNASQYPHQWAYPSYRARNACGWSAYETASIGTLDCNGGEEPEFTYPNPTADQLNVNIEQSHEGEASVVTLTNSYGKIVHSESTNSSKLLISVVDFEPGIYQLSIKNNKGIQRKRVIIKR